jgi:iron complex transport system substrate-binding protein
MVQPRIVSLIASSTEIVCALGFQQFLVGRSHECDYPPAVKNLPQCTSPKFQTDGTSYEIDQRVKAIVEQSLSVYRVDADLLERLRPTHIITQAQCEVCAVSIGDVEQAVCQFTSSQPKVISLQPNSLADIWSDIRNVANALDAADKGDDLIARLQARMSNIAQNAASSSFQPSVACIEWIDPLMAAGNWMPELIAMAGGKNLFGEAGKHSPWMNWRQLVESNPDVIVVSPCGFDIARTMQEMNLLTDRPEWPQLKAVQAHRVYVADGNQFFNRPGPRVVESLEIAAEILHPEQFTFGHEGAGWKRW